MNWTGVTVSLLVALAPANRCDPGGQSPPSAAPDDTPPGENVSASGNAGAPETPESPKSVSATEDPQAPQTVSAPGTAPPPQGLSPETPPASAPDLPPSPAAYSDNGGSFAETGNGGYGGNGSGYGYAGNGSGYGESGGGSGYGESGGGYGENGSYDAAGYDDADPSALSEFRSALDPYGTWSDDATLGAVWAPSPDSVGPDFRPYATAGHWTYDSEWIWVSDYVWGWVPFHYGRWIFVRGRGWSWVPGRAYRGAWVLWSVDAAASYLAWAPAPPSFLWIRGVAVAWQGPLVGASWVFCPRAAVFAPALDSRIIAGAAAIPIAARMRLPSTASSAAGIAGPTPERLGFSAAQVPHPAGAAAAGVARALQLSRPSTAIALGARPPTRTSPVSLASAPTGAPGAAVPGAWPWVANSPAVLNAGGTTAGARNGGRRR